MAITAREWVYPQNEARGEKVVSYAKLLHVSPLVARVLLNRGMTDPTEAKKFIERRASSLHSPYLLNDMAKAVERIQRALAAREKITIYGDYDVDGITSTTMMVSYLRFLGGIVDAYIPDRQNEGYGVNHAAVEKIISGGTKLIITVDTGITASEEVIFAREHGVDAIITDHHECREVLPPAVAVINPKRVDSTYPFKDLAGVGVAFKLLCALSDGDTTEMLNRYSDIVALGTIADVVSLTDENRVITGLGLEKLRKNPNLGLSEIIKTVGSTPKWNNSAVVSYAIAPRINAAGRMSSAMMAVKLLLTHRVEDAEAIATELDRENKERQVCESVIFAEAQEMLKDPYYESRRVLVLAKRGWHHGIIGVVASRICDKYQKSCILIAIEDEWCKASGRSVNGMNLYEGLSECDDILENFGGHAYAAGFSIREGYIKLLDRRLNEYADRMLPKVITRTLSIDACVEIGDVSLAAVRDTEVLAPYGTGNKMPIFAIKEAVILDIKTLSDGKHCRLIIQKNRRTLEVIGFGQGKVAEDYRRGELVDVAGEMNVNIYNGEARVQLILSDIRFSGSDVPQKEDFAAIYKFIRARAADGFFETDIMALTRTVGEYMNQPITKGRLENVILIFEDIDILRYSMAGSLIKITLVPRKPGTKVNTAQSAVYKLICGKQ